MIREVVKIFDQDLFENIQVGDQDVGLLANVVPTHHKNLYILYSKLFRECIPPPSQSQEKHKMYQTLSF